MSNGVFNFNFVALLLSEILGGSQIYIRRPYAPQTPSSGESFLHTASTSQYLIVFLISTFQLQQFPSFQRVPNLRQGALCPLYAPRGKIFVPQASTLLCLMAFSTSSFQLLYFPRYYGGPKFTLWGPTLPGRPLSKNFFTQSEYFTISNCVFNFNILALVVSEIVGVPYLRQGPCAPHYPPQRKHFCTRGKYFTMSNSVFNFNFLALLLSGILGGSQIYTRGPYAPWTPNSEPLTWA